jgi:hypothetical protein
MVTAPAAHAYARESSTQPSGSSSRQKVNLNPGLEIPPVGCDGRPERRLRRLEVGSGGVAPRLRCSLRCGWRQRRAGRTDHLATWAGRRSNRSVGQPGGRHHWPAGFGAGTSYSARSSAGFIWTAGGVHGRHAHALSRPRRQRQRRDGVGLVPALDNKGLPPTNVRSRGWPGERSGAEPRRVPPRVPSTCQATVQAAPLRVNALGAAVLPVCVAWKPKLTDALGAIAAL